MENKEAIEKGIGVSEKEASFFTFSLNELKRVSEYWQEDYWSNSAIRLIVS